MNGLILGSTERIWEDEWTQLFDSEPVEPSAANEDPSVEEKGKRRKSKGAKSKKFLQSKSKRYKSSSSSQGEAETNQGEVSVPPEVIHNSHAMATTEEEAPVNAAGESGVESEGEAKEIKPQTEDDESQKAKDGQDEEDKGDGESKRTVASKSEGEEEDEGDVFPEGAVSQSPVKAQTLPATSSPMSATSPTSPTSPTSADKKKKRFHPLKSIRKLFRKRTNKDEEDVLPTQPLSRSTGHLDRSDTDEDDMDRSKSVSPTLLGGRMSMSEDSVFSPDPADDHSLSRPVTPANKDFANELASKLQNRQPATPSKKEEKAPPSSQVEVASESSTRDSGVILDDEKSFSPSSASAGPAVAAKQKIQQKKQVTATESFGDFNSIAPTSLLKSDAAKHRISVRPQGRTRRPPSRIRPVSTPIRTQHEDISTRAKTPSSTSSSSSPGLSPPALKVPKENKPAQRSNSDRRPNSDSKESSVKRTPSDASKDKTENKLSRKPSKEKAVGPPAVTKRKDSKEDETSSAKQSLSRKASKETDLPDVQENGEVKKEEPASAVKGKQPLMRKSSKERAVSPPNVQKRNKEEEDVTQKKPSHHRASKETSLPDVVEGSDVKSDKIKDSEDKHKKPKSKSPVKPPVDHKSNADKVTVKRSSSKTESDSKDKPVKTVKETVSAKDEEKENKAPSPAPETTSEQKSTPESKEPKEKESAEKKLAGVLASKAMFESEPAPAKPQDKEVQDADKTVAKEDKPSEKISTEEKKKPVTPPKPRKQFKKPESVPANKNDDKSDEETPSKPLSLKERMALLKSAAEKKDTNDKSSVPSWKTSQPPRPVSSKPVKADAKPGPPKNIFIQVTDSPKSSVENGTKEVDSNDRAGVKDLIKQWQHNRPKQTANAL